MKLFKKVVCVTLCLILALPISTSIVNATDDAMFLSESFKNQTVGSAPAAGTVAGGGFTQIQSTVTVATDPNDNTNLVGKYLASSTPSSPVGTLRPLSFVTSAGNYIQTPFVLSGKLLLGDPDPKGGNGAYADLRLRGTNQYGNAANATGNLDIMRVYSNNREIQTSNGTNLTKRAYYLPGEWLNFTIVFRPALRTSTPTTEDYKYYANNCSYDLYLSGGVSTTDNGEPAPVVITGLTANLSALTVQYALSALFGTATGVLAYDETATGGFAYTPEVYYDDLKAYIPGDFTMSKVGDTQDLVASETNSITLNFNHPVQTSTLSASNITITKSDLTTIPVSSITGAESNLTEQITFNLGVGLSSNSTYTIALNTDAASGVKDLNNSTVSNSITITTAAAENETAIISSVTTDQGELIIQKYGEEAQVDFTAVTNPVDNIDLSTVKWYVNDELQSTSGLSFSYTPPSSGAYRVEPRVSNNIMAVCNSTTILVENQWSNVISPMLDTDCSSSAGLTLSGASVSTYPETGGTNSVIKMSGDYGYAKKSISLTEPMTFKGKVLMPEGAGTPFLRIHLDGTHGTFANHLLYFAPLKNDKLALDVNNQAQVGLYVPGQWVNYETTVIPNLSDPANSTQIYKIWGDGVTNTNGTALTAPIEGSRVMNLSNIADLANTTVEFRAHTTPTEYPFVDDLYVAPAPAFELDVIDHAALDVNSSVLVNFNEPVNISTLDGLTNKVLVTDSSNNEIEIEDVSVDSSGKAASITFAEPLANNMVYKLCFMPSVKNTYGVGAYNIVYFATGTAGVPAPYRVVDKKVTGIVLDPTEVTVWQDFGAPVRFAASILPTDASNQTVTWQSSDTSVATVNSETGYITLVGVGTTNIIATAADGSGIVSAPAVLNVTAPKNRAANQKLNLPPTDSDRIGVAEALAFPDEVGEGVVALWSGNKRGAVTISVDDNKNEDYDQWNTWINTYHIPATFFVRAKMLSEATGATANMAMEKTLLEAGHAVESHTWFHSNDDTYLKNMTTAQSIIEFGKSQEYINNTTAEYGNKANVIAYSNGKLSDDYGYEVASEYYIAGRGTWHVSAVNFPGKIDYMNLTSNTVDGLNRLTAYMPYITSLTDPASANYGGWYSLHTHGLAASDESGSATDFYNQLFSGNFGGNLPNLWVDKIANVAMYGQERDTATLDIVPSANSISYTLTDEMDDTIFNYPLTVKLKVDSAWDEITATQNGEQLNVTVVENENGKFALIETIPDKGSVTVAPEAEGAVAGDINADGVISVSDVIMAAQIAVGDTDYTPEQVARANVSDKDDVTVDISDVVLIAERVVDGTTSFPVDRQ